MTLFIGIVKSGLTFQNRPIIKGMNRLMHGHIITQACNMNALLVISSVVLALNVVNGKVCMPPMMEAKMDLYGGASTMYGGVTYGSSQRVSNNCSHLF